MGGFAGIKSKKQNRDNENEEIRKLKRAIYEKIAKNFDIFEFLDDDNPGDDELNQDDDLVQDFDDYASENHRGNRNHVNREDLVEVLDENHQSESPN
jgi:hypothetical protein